MQLMIIRAMLNFLPGATLSQNSQQTAYHAGSSQLSGTACILFKQTLTEKRFLLYVGDAAAVLSAEVVFPELVSLP